MPGQGARVAGLRDAAWALPSYGPLDAAALTALAQDLREARPRPPQLGAPARPPAVDPGRWRRMSRLGRLAVREVAGLLAQHPDLDRHTLPLVHGTALGEVVPGSAFLDRLLTEGPATASPLAFQGSTANATAAHVSLALGLRGHAETISAGMATGLMALARGIELLDRAPAVLVLVADDINPVTLAAHAGLAAAPGEAVVALLLAPHPGALGSLAVRDGVVDGPGPRLCRGLALPYERAFVALDGLRPEIPLGLSCAGGLLAALSGAGHAVDQDDRAAITGWRQR